MDNVHREEPVVVRDFETSAHFLAEFMCSDQSKTFRYPQGLLFRGEASDKFKLIPNALRPENQERFMKLARGAKLLYTDIKQLEDENLHIDGEYALMKYFYRKANQKGLVLPSIPYVWHERMQTLSRKWMEELDAEWIPKELAEVSALMQHYGFPTRMLDWSSSVLTALYFAAYGAAKRKRNNEAEDSEHMVIWILRRPWSTIEDFIPSEAFPIRFVTPSYANNPNLNAQKGVLSYVPVPLNGKKTEKYRMPLDEFLKEHYSVENRVCHETILTKARIPINNYKHTLQILSSFGVDSSSVFPGYGSVFNQVEEDSFTIR